MNGTQVRAWKVDTASFFRVPQMQQEVWGGRKAGKGSHLPEEVLTIMCATRHRTQPQAKKLGAFYRHQIFYNSRGWTIRVGDGSLVDEYQQPPDSNLSEGGC